MKSIHNWDKDGEALSEVGLRSKMKSIHNRTRALRSAESVGLRSKMKSIHNCAALSTAYRKLV